MPIIHKVVEGGGEQYLGWALNREKALRKQTGDRAIKYDLGDAEVEIRIVGNQSFIFMRATGVQVSDEWVAFQLYMQTEFSLSNAVETTNGPEGTEQPTGPTPPTSGNPPILTKPNPADYEENSTGPNGETYQTGLVRAIHEVQKSARRPLLEQYYTLTSPNGSITPQQQNQIEATLQAQRNYKGVTWGGTNEYGDGIPIYNPAKDYTIAYWQWEIDQFTATKAWEQAAAAAMAAYQVELAAFIAGPLLQWQQQNYPSFVCPPYFLDLIGKQRSGRQLQINRLKAEQAMGMKALPVFNPVMHPQYIPKEQPLVPFFDGAGVWTPDGTYVPMPNSYTDGQFVPAVPTCGGTVPGRTYVNGYDLVRMSLERAFGYVVNGTVRSIEASVPPLASVTNLSNYEAWLNSSRGPGGTSVSFDFFHGTQVAEVYFAFFEYEAYDFTSDLWVWTPSLSLLSNSPLISCYSLCYTYPDHERDATYSNRPDPIDGVRTMRSTGFYKQVRASDGTWSDLISVGGSPITIDLSPLTSSGAVYGYALPDGVVALKGVKDWMLPVFPHPSLGVTEEYLGGVTIPASLATISNQDEFAHWLYAQCLNRFQIPFQ